MYKNNNGNGNNDDLQSVDSTTTTESKTVTEKKEKEEKNKEFSIAEDTPSSSQRVPRQSSAPPDLKASTTSDNENVTSTALTRRIRKKSRTLIDNIETKKRKLTDNGSNNENKYAPPSVKLENVGGIEHILQDIIQLILMPFKHLEIHLHLGIKPPRGILLHGPPGCGKTLLANAIAGELNVPFLNISAPSIVSGMSGESEKKLREFFEEAKEQAPCLLFIDEIDAITPKRETAQREMERRIVAQLLTCLDDLSLEKTNNRPVMIIGATNRPDSLDPALRRAGRFDREISMGVPDEEGREKILKVLCKDLRLSDDLNFRALAKLTPGYVGADLSALTSEAGMIAVERIYGNLLNSVEEEEEENKENENESEQEQQDDSTMEKDEEEKEEEEREGEEGEEKDTEESMDIDEPVSETKKDETEKESETENKPLIKKDGIKPHEITLEILSKFIKSKSEPLTDEELKPLCITIEDFQKAVKKVQPSSKREGFATVPGVSWDDVGALETVREELNMAVVEPIRHPEYFAAVGITAPMGVLLYGPPGCGKTLLAKAVANESHSNFISVKGPELLNKYVGESERAIRQVFSRARASSPCVIFFDELDAICPKRSNDTDSTSSARLVNTLLTEMDGLDNRKQVFVIAATNRPELIDSAMVRPGRLDRMLYVDLPTAPERLDILKTITKKTPLDNTIDLEKIANDPRCEGFSGADLASLVREASVTALRTSIYKNETSIKKSTLSLSNALPDDDTKKIDSIYVCPSHFDVAFSKIVRSVSPKDYRSYKLMSKRLSGVRGKFISKSESIEDVSSAPKDTPTPSTEKPEDVSTTTTTPFLTLYQHNYLPSRISKDIFRKGASLFSRVRHLLPIDQLTGIIKHVGQILSFKKAKIDRNLLNIKILSNWYTYIFDD
ncbi:AAA-domain-containing protein [Piromyces finnis]|uniref:AAA-domain-containing protein n=1 Tax=Piromyces finnis TaxID=1754191 RepID=A0A1Y1UWG1_9FUNG|nr:AAA-domain-containing protein [Piromyces finnis]|eukprot:ORX41956.1 AAA-domain-containing protein [Piromyces finnis]